MLPEASRNLAPARRTLRCGSRHQGTRVEGGTLPLMTLIKLIQTKANQFRSVQSVASVVRPIAVAGLYQQGLPRSRFLRSLLDKDPADGRTQVACPRPFSRECVKSEHDEIRGEEHHAI